MTWVLRKTFRFESAHRLPSHEGKCHRLHGHDWKITLVLESDTLQPDGPAAGMVMDFYTIKQIVQGLLEELDHRFLNDLPGLSNPTSEVLAQWAFNRLEGRVPELAAIVIDETDGASCEYRP